MIFHLDNKRLYPDKYYCYLVELNIEPRLNEKSRVTIHFGGDSIKDVYEKTDISTYSCVLLILCVV